MKQLEAKLAAEVGGGLAKAAEAAQHGLHGAGRRGRA